MCRAPLVEICSARRAQLLNGLRSVQRHTASLCDTRIVPTAKTIGIVVLAALAAKSRGRSAESHNERNIAANQLLGKTRQSVKLSSCPAPSPDVRFTPPKRDITSVIGMSRFVPKADIPIEF